MMKRIEPRSWVAAAVGCVAMLGVAQTSWANSGFYTFVDSRGVTHFTNIPNDSRYVPILKPKEKKRRSPAPQNFGYDGLIRLTAAEHRVSPALVKAVIAAESHFNQLAVSSR